jgi:predicted transcriptional regulator
MPDTHLMIVNPQYASRIMTGQKLVEARLGTDRSAPYNRVQPGDIVYIKPSGQRVIGKAVVHRVDQYSGLNPNDIDHLQRVYNDRVQCDDAFWDAKRDSNYATFITLNRVAMIVDESTVPAALLAPSADDWRVLHDESQQKQQPRRAA